MPLEAMLAGVPVLAANSGGPLETVLEGQTGWLRPVDEVEKWSDIMDLAVHRLSQEEFDRMSELGRRRVCEEFSESTMAQRLNEEFEQMERRPRHSSLGTTVALALSMVVGLVCVLTATYLWS